MFKDVKVGFVSASSSIKRGNKKTTIFIIFVLSLIFINLVFLPSMINGLMKTIIGFVQDYSYGDIIIEPTKENAYINNADDVLQKVRSINGVSAAAKRLDVGASIQYKQKVVGVTVTGLIPKDEEDVSQYPYIISQGDFLGELSRDEIIIGAMIAGVGFGAEIYDNLGEVKPGSLVDVIYSNGVNKTYKVKGIMEGTFELTDLNALINYKELDSVFGLEGNKATSIVVRVDNPGEEDKIKDKIISVGVKEDVFTWQEKAETLVRQAMQSIGSIDIVSRFISLVVGAALILIIIYINVLNRKREIGILKAIGIAPRSIRISYVFISLFYVSMGILLGLIIYLLSAFYLQANPVMFYETIKISPEINIWALIQNALIMIGMSVIAGFIPAWLVSRQNILEAVWGR